MLLHKLVAAFGPGDTFFFLVIPSSSLSNCEGLGIEFVLLGLFSLALVVPNCQTTIVNFLLLVG